MPCGRRNAALFVQIKTLERLQETIGQKLSNPHSAPFLALFRVAGRQKDALAGNGVLEQCHEPGEHNADHDLQQVNQPPGPLITNRAATGMWYTIKVRLAKSRPVPWLTVHGTDTMADAPSLSMPSANRTILTDRSRSGQHAALSF